MKPLTALGICLLCCHSAFSQSAPTDQAYHTLTLGISYRPLKLSGMNQLLNLGAYPAINPEWTVLHISREIEWRKVPYWSTWLNFSLGNQRQRKEDPRSTEASLLQVSAGFGIRVWDNKRLSLITQAGIDITSFTVRCYDLLIDTTNVAAYISAQQSDTKRLTCSQSSMRTGLLLRRINKDGTTFKVSSGYNIPLQPATISHYRGSFGDLLDTRLGGFYISAEFGFAWPRSKD